MPQDTFKLTSPLPVAPVTTQTAQEAFTSVIANAGCTLPNRDSADIRVINEIKSGVAPFGATYNGGGKGIIDSPTDVGGWPVEDSLPAPLDSDHDGMPDNWELAHGLNPNDPSDRNTITSSGYTMLEEYLNGINAQTGIVSVNERSLEQANCEIKQNYPNPFNPSTTIDYELQKSDMISLKVYDIYGREITTLEDGTKPAGRYQTVFHGGKLSSGVYFVRLITEKKSQTIKLILAK